MKKILITGANSYVGTNVEKWLGNASLGTYQADTVSVRGEAWKDLSFSEYDVVFHVAGIAHVSANPKMKDLYFAVNRDLTLEVAKKAKEDGVKYEEPMSLDEWVDAADKKLYIGKKSGKNRMVP